MKAKTIRVFVGYTGCENIELNILNVKNDIARLFDLAMSFFEL